MLLQIFHRSIGLVSSVIFLFAVWAFPVPWMQRYFLGHSVAIAATILFGVAVAALVGKWIAIQRQRRLCDQIRMMDLAPPDNKALIDATRVINVKAIASIWLESLEQLSESVRDSLLVQRVSETLKRQMQRGNARQLADDLREISGRQADAAHDSLQLVRIIVWAIPMLGFLGTVIGITQTLGGLDFSDGQAAVDQLKKGLYVAFDTTALGLVLSVVAIFLQFPVERAEQSLLASIDQRTGELLVDHLPDPSTDGSAGHIAALCDGVLLAVNQAVESQAHVWKSTIDDAHAHWQTLVSSTNEELSQAMGNALRPVLANHAQELQRVQTEGTSAIDQRWHQWQITLSDNMRALASYQETLIEQAKIFAESQSRAEQMAVLEKGLEQNILSLESANRSVDRSLQGAAAAEGLSEAVVALARAVDFLTTQLPDRPSGKQRHITGRVA